MLLGLVWVPICSPETVIGVIEATSSGMWPTVEMPAAIFPVSCSLSVAPHGLPWLGQMREKNPQAPSGLKPCVLLRILNISDNRKKQKSTKDGAMSCEQGMAGTLNTISKAKLATEAAQPEGWVTT